MAPLPPVPNVLRIAFEQSYENQPNLMIFHAFYTGSGLNQTDLDTVAANLANSITSWCNPVQTNDCVNKTITLTDLSSDTGLVSVQPVSGAGTAGSSAVVANSAMCNSWHIHRRYRGGHPRNYIGGMDSSNFATERSFKTTVVTAQTARCQALLAAVPSDGTGAFDALELVNVSYFSGGARRDTPVVDTLLTGTVNSRPDSQRRRLGKVAG